MSGNIAKQDQIGPNIPRLIEKVGKKPCVWPFVGFGCLVIRGGFLSEEDRKALVASTRDNLAAGRRTRRANALVLLDDGMSCQEVAKVLLFDDDTIRSWRDLFEQGGVEGLTRFDVGGSSSEMSAEQAEVSRASTASTLPRSTRQVGAWVSNITSRKSSRASSTRKLRRLSSRVTTNR